MKKEQPITKPEPKRNYSEINLVNPLIGIKAENLKFIQDIPLESEKDFAKYIFDIYINKEKRKELFNFLLSFKNN